MNESMRKIIYYENILEFKQNTKSELHLNEVNNWQLCRTCLVESDEGDWDLEKMCVMDAFEGRFLNAQQMLDRVTAIQLNQEDDLPLKMCKDCLEKLTSLYFFSMQIQKAEKVLKNLSLKLRGGEAVAEGQNNTGSKEEHTDSKDCDSDADAVVLSSEGVNQVEDPPVAVDDDECGSDDGNKCKVSISAKILKLSKDNDQNSSSVVDDQEYDIESKEESDCGGALLSKEEEAECESTIVVEDAMDSNEVVLMEVEEDFEEIINEELESYDFEDCKETDEVSFENENVAKTVEIYLNDELEEHFEEKDNWEEDIENNEGDVEIVVPNTLLSDEDASATSAEPVRITRATRVTKSTKKSLFKHKQKRVTEPLLESRKCGLCQESFKLQRDLVSHVEEHHPNCKAYQCRECGELFSYTQSLSRHMNSHKDKLHKTKCSYCPKAFLRPYDLIRHIRTHTGERPYKCPKCNRAFKQQGEMKQHLTTHLERREYECNQCCCVLTSRNSLYLHKKSKHSKPEDQQLKCSHCKKGFKSKRALLDHKKRLHTIAKKDGGKVRHAVVEE